MRDDSRQLRDSAGNFLSEAVDEALDVGARIERRILHQWREVDREDNRGGDVGGV